MIFVLGSPSKGNKILDTLIIRLGEYNGAWHIGIERQTRLYMGKTEKGITVGLGYNSIS